jgi:predicted lipoprotein with Yx(FWY)xxD motif
VIPTVTGGQQLTYKGHPLYYFGGDNLTKGSTKGISVPTPGAAVWKVANTATVALQ